MAPQVRLELTTLRLTAECSAIELLRNFFFALASCSGDYLPAHITLSLRRRHTRGIAYPLAFRFFTLTGPTCRRVISVSSSTECESLTHIRPSLVSRRRLIFPESLPSSIVSAEELNFCVRYGYRWILFAITTGNFSVLLPFCIGVMLGGLPTRSHFAFLHRRHARGIAYPLAFRFCIAQRLLPALLRHSEPSKLHKASFRLPLLFRTLMLQTPFRLRFASLLFYIEDFIPHLSRRFAVSVFTTTAFFLRILTCSSYFALSPKLHIFTCFLFLAA